MSHEVETCFSVREVPWHGLGTIVQEQLTSADAIKSAGLDWKVDSRPIYTDIPSGAKAEIPGRRANVRDTDNSVLGIVSDRYKIVQNSEAFDFTDSLIGEGCRYETAGALFGGKKIWLLASLPEQKILDDEVIPYVCFTNSHDGMGAIQAIMTPVRVVCNNTLNLALRSAKRSWSTKHMGDLGSKLAEARHTLELANDYMDCLSDEADRLANIKVTDEKVHQILDDLFPVNEEDGDRKKRNVSELKDKFMVFMFAPDILKFKGTAWGVVQAASDFATHVAPKRSLTNYQENNFNRVLDGHAILDTVYSKVSV